MKIIIDLEVVSNRIISGDFCMMKLAPADRSLELPDAVPGQFVQVRVDDSPSTFLRRPISICDADKHQLTLLIRRAGEGTAHIMALKPGDIVNMILPLGTGFTTALPSGSKAMLVGGGVGIAPMHMLGKWLSRNGVDVTFLIGARTESMLLMRDELERYGKVLITTDDGSAGVKGVVTAHPDMAEIGRFAQVYCCGPSPMMKAVARVARESGVSCEVSLENLMACGVGACLCCVEQTVKGNVCVCKEGPVFNINQLTW